MDKKIRKIKKLVREVLTTDIRSRCSDMWLYTKIIEISEIEGLTDSEKQMLIYLLRKAHLPNYLSVTRARQRIQSESPELSEHLTKKKRKELERIYREEYPKLQ